MKKRAASKKAGFLGLGTMGQGMAANLHRAGRLACAWNRTRSRVEEFAARSGIRLADSPEQVARECDLLITCVSADDDLHQVVDQVLPELRPGAVLVDCSTVSAATARSVAGQTTAAGGSFLDAPVSGGVEGARKGSLAMMVGGDTEVLESVRPMLQAMAAQVVYMGPTGSGQATKAVNQIMAAGINQAVSEALAFGAAQGLDLERVTQVVSQGAAGSWFLSHRGPNMIAGRYAPGFKVSLHRKDLHICQAMARERGVALSVVEQTLGDYQRLMDQAHGDEDISALFRIKKDLFGV
jgi:3-hydroxyisobutyrate dehydrogenase